MLKKVLNSKSLIFIIAAMWLCVIVPEKRWEKDLVVNDVVSYYGYLPAAVINKDLRLDFIVGHSEYATRYWPETAPNGGKVIKTTMGLAFLYAPFFFLGHFTANAMGYPADGYSAPYMAFLLLSCLFYLIVGFCFLRKLLLLFFSEAVTCLTMLSVFFGTNLFFYSTFDGPLSHAYLFTFVTVFVYLVVKWHSEPKVKTAIFIGLTGGLLTLIRPTMILCFLIFALYNVYGKQSLIEKFRLFKSRITHLLLIGVFAFLVLLPQLLYWKYTTGNFFFFSYVGERFYWDHPHITEGLFGFRKGWLLYTPVMIFAVAGIFFLRKRLPAFFLPLWVLFPLLIYVLFSWWAWWYGGSFGMRALIDYYGFFALPMACFYTYIFQSKIRILKWVLVPLVFALIYLNIFQSWQFSEGLIHYDSMTKESYMIGFTKTKSAVEWYEALEEPSYDRARRGLPEAYSDAEVKQINAQNKICFKGYNDRLISCEINGGTELTSTRPKRGDWETFSFIPVENNKIVIKAANGKYVTADQGNGGILYGNREQVGGWERFELIYLGNNKIALKTESGKYVGVNPDSPNTLIAKSDSITKAEKFRIYID